MTQIDYVKHLRNNEGASISDIASKEDYQGSDRTVREYVRKAKEKLRIQGQRQFIRLEQFLAEAQVDFGEFIAINGGLEKTYHELIMSFPYSNAQVCIVLPSENAVCFLHGLQSLFHLIGGVPKVIRFDNRSALFYSAKMFRYPSRLEQ